VKEQGRYFGSCSVGIFFLKKAREPYDEPSGDSNLLIIIEGLRYYDAYNGN